MDCLPDTHYHPENRPISVVDFGFSFGISSSSSGSPFLGLLVVRSSVRRWPDTRVTERKRQNTLVFGSNLKEHPWVVQLDGLILQRGSGEKTQPEFMRIREKHQSRMTGILQKNCGRCKIIWNMCFIFWVGWHVKKFQMYNFLRWVGWWARLFLRKSELVSPKTVFF